MTEQTVYQWITETGANHLREDGIADWSAPDGRHGIIWEAHTETIVSASLGDGFPTAPGTGGAVVRAWENSARPDNYEAVMADTARYLTEQTARLILDLDDALTAVIALTGIGEEIGTHEALRAMHVARLREPVTVTFASDTVQRTP